MRREVERTEQNRGTRRKWTQALYGYRNGSSVLPVFGIFPPVYSCVCVFSLQWQHDWQGQATLPHLKPKSALAPQTRRRRVFSQPPDSPPPTPSAPLRCTHTCPRHTAGTHTHTNTHIARCHHICSVRGILLLPFFLRF